MSTHPTDAIIAEIRRLYDSTRPEHVDEAVRLRLRWSRRIARRAARKGHRGRRGSLTMYEAPDLCAWRP